MWLILGTHEFISCRVSPSSPTELRTYIPFVYRRRFFDTLFFMWMLTFPKPSDVYLALG